MCCVLVSGVCSVCVLCVLRCTCVCECHRAMTGVLCLLSPGGGQLLASFQFGGCGPLSGRASCHVSIFPLLVLLGSLPCSSPGMKRISDNYPKEPNKDLGWHGTLSIHPTKHSRDVGFHAKRHTAQGTLAPGSSGLRPQALWSRPFLAGVRSRLCQGVPWRVICGRCGWGPGQDAQMGPYLPEANRHCTRDTLMKRNGERKAKME